jgi:Ser/Thr protein kinase RdoA (MazF antagonist)
MTDTETPFANLDPSSLLAAIESLGLRCDGSVLALNSYENRVFRVGIEDAAPIVAKFYRPGRWSDDSILEEHDFVDELAESGLSVVAPLCFDEQTLHQHGGHRFALFPLQGGRAPEPGDKDTLRRIGQAMAQLHGIGARSRFEHRPELSVARFGHEPLATLLQGGWVPRELRGNLESVGNGLLRDVERVFAEVGPVRQLRLHGDCHAGNLLWRDDLPHFVDFDDCLTGPAVQDLWMLISGDAADTQQQRDWLMEGYELFRDIDAGEWRLIEPLRALRLLHFNAWIARRWHDPAFPHAFPWFGEPRHWESALGQLQEQWAVLRET